MFTFRDRAKDHDDRDNDEDDEGPERIKPGARTLAQDLLPYRAEMEAAFGESFADVEVRTGERDAMAQIGAVAAAEGNKITFADARPEPWLVAHELTHVMQYRNAGGGGPIMRKATISAVDSTAEREADQVADRVTRGQRAGSISARPAADIQRAAVEPEATNPDATLAKVIACAGQELEDESHLIYRVDADGAFVVVKAPHALKRALDRKIARTGMFAAVWAILAEKLVAKLAETRPAANAPSSMPATTSAGDARFRTRKPKASGTTLDIALGKADSGKTTKYLRDRESLEPLLDGDPDATKFWCSGFSMWTLAMAGYDLKQTLVGEDGVPFTFTTDWDDKKLRKKPKEQPITLKQVVDGEGNAVEAMSKALAGGLAKGRSVGYLSSTKKDKSERDDAVWSETGKGAASAFALARIGAEVPEAQQKPGDFAQSRYKTSGENGPGYYGFGHAWQVATVTVNGSAMFGQPGSPRSLAGALTGWHDDVRFVIDGTTDPGRVGGHAVLTATRVEANIKGAMAHKAKDTDKDGGVQVTGEFAVPDKKGAEKREGYLVFYGRLGTSAWAAWKPATDPAKPGTVQRRASGGLAVANPVAIAARGVSGSGGSLPHRDAIQQSFGHHDVSSISAHIGGAAAEAAVALEASAYAVGNSIGFASTPDLHTAAHEAAHVIQQRRGVSLAGDLDGGAGDPLEQHADRVADAVVAGASAAELLDGGTSGGSARGVQRRAWVDAGSAQTLMRIIEGADPAKLQQIEAALARGALAADAMVPIDVAGFGGYVARDDVPRLQDSVQQRKGSQPAEGMDSIIWKYLGYLWTFPKSGAYGLKASKDAALRLDEYVKPARELSLRVMHDIAEQELTHLKGRRVASQGRNDLREGIREKISPGARGMSQAVEAKGPTVRKLAEKYALKLLEEDPAFRARYGVKTPGPKDAATRRALGKIIASPEVSHKIIEAAGKPNKIMNGMARTIRVLGPVGVGWQAATGIYHVVEAEEGNHLFAVGHEIAGFTGASLGSEAGGLLVGALGAAAVGAGIAVSAPVAIVVSLVVIGGAGGIGALVGQSVWDQAVDPASARELELEIKSAIEQLARATGTLAASAFPVHARAAGGGLSGIMERDRRQLDDVRDPSKAPHPASDANMTADDGTAVHADARVQRKANSDAALAPPDPVAIASRGIASGGGSLPHLDLIQQSFGHHDVSTVSAHVGGAATEASRSLDARAYAIGNSVAFATTPDLHTAAHEAAHVVQQRRGVTLAGSLDGGSGDPLEQHADAVAASVVAGRSAEALLDRAGNDRESSQAAVQRAPAGMGDVHAAEARDHDAAMKAPAASFVDAFVDGHYDLGYKAVGGNLSTIVRLRYLDGVTIDFEIFQLGDDRPAAVQISEAMREPIIGAGGRLYPALLNRGTAPRLWAVKQAVIATMEEDNVALMTTAINAILPVIIGVATVPATMREPAPPATRVRAPRATVAFDPKAVATEIIETVAKEGGGARGQFNAALKMLAGRALTQAEKAQVIEEILRKIGFAMQPAERIEATLVLTAENGLARVLLEESGAMHLETLNKETLLWIRKW